MVTTPFKAALLTLALAFVASTARATTIDFEGVVPTNSYASYGMGTYSTNGYNISASSSAWIFSAGYYGQNVIGSDGTAYYMFQSGSNATLTSTASKLFDVSSVDLGNWSGSANALLTGTFADGTTVSSYYDLNNNNALTTNDFTTANLTGFTNLMSFKITAGGNYVQVDNIAINAAAAAVPEPASLALLGLGLAAIGAVRRKKSV
jgi:hypothetical protein